MKEKEPIFWAKSENPEAREANRLGEVFNDEKIEQSMTFQLSTQESGEGALPEVDAYWFSLQDGPEGKVFLPKNGDPNKLAIFEPGLPGDSVDWFEGRHAPVLAKDGYTVISVRHRGLRTDTEKSRKYVNCEERITKGSELGRPTLGGDGTYSLTEISEEPAHVLNALRHDRLPDEITLIGHSAGSLYHAYSLSTNRVDPQVTERVKNIVSLGGYVDMEARGPRFGDIKDYYKWCQSLLRMSEPEENIEKLKKIFEETSQGHIPDHVMVTLVQSPEDEYVSLEGADRFQEKLGRGLVIVDMTQSAKEGEEVHDYGNMRPETLLRLVRMHYPRSKHRVAVSSRSPKE